MTLRQARKVVRIWVLEPWRCGPYKIRTYATARRKLRRRFDREVRRRLTRLTPEQRFHFGAIRIPTA